MIAQESSVPARLHPFPGLRSFTEQEAHLYFGRDGQSNEIVRILERSGLLAVVGTSGSGKSSLVRAGLMVNGMAPSTIAAGALHMGSRPPGHMGGGPPGYRNGPRPWGDWADP